MPPKMCFLWSKGFPISGHLPKLSVISLLLLGSACKVGKPELGWIEEGRVTELMSVSPPTITSLYQTVTAPYT